MISRNLKIIILILSLIAVGNSVWLVLNYAKPMRLLIETRPVLPQLRSLINDFDHDGYSEEVEIQIEVREDSSGWTKPLGTKILVNSYNYRSINQLNLPFIMYRQIAFTGDYDGNQLDELYLFSIENDSLFLWIIDPLNEPNIKLHRQFCLFVGGNEYVRKGKVPDIFITHSFTKYSEDHFNDLVLYIQTGYGYKPRKFVVLDLRNEKLLFVSPPMGFATQKFGFIDTNRDGKNECVIFQSNSSGNGPDKDYPYSDHSVWAITLKGDLTETILKREYPGAFLESKVFLLPLERVCVIVNSLSAKRSNSLIQILDKEFIPTKELILEDQRVFSSGLYPNDYNPTGFWILGNNGVTRIFDFDLVEQGAIPHSELISYPIFFEGDLDNDGRNEYLFRTKSDMKYGILGSNFKSTYIFETDGDIGYTLRHNVYAFMKFIRSGKPVLFFRTANTAYELSYLANPWYYLSFLLPILVGLITYFTLYFVLSYLISRQITLQIARDFRTFKPGLIGIFSAEGNLLYWYNQQSYWTGVLSFLEKPENKNWVTDLIRKNKKTSLSFFHDFPELNSCSVSLSPVSVFRSKLIIAWQMEINSTTRDQRLQLWSKVMQKMVHDLKTPLSSMSLNLRTLKMKLEDSGLEKSMGQPELSLMESEIKRLRDQSRQFLRMVNLEPPKLSSVNLIFLIRLVCDRFSSFFNDGTELTLDLPDEPVYANLDQAQWEFVFQTLIENSIDALNNGGTLNISLSSIHQLDQDFKPAVEIQVSDTGKGIPKENLDQIFEPYFTTKREGNGLGLAVVKKIIEDHSGQIRAESDPGKWTTFTIIIPQTESKVN